MLQIRYGRPVKAHSSLGKSPNSVVIESSLLFQLSLPAGYFSHPKISFNGRVHSS